MRRPPTYAPYALTERFERRFGDPDDASRAFSLARCAELDEREEFPAGICRDLDDAGVPGYYVPARHGGAAHTYEDTLQVVRLLARRDLTVAIAHGKTFLGAVSAWVGAEPAQARALGEAVVAGQVVAWGLTERAHGGDLLAGEVAAEPSGAGYRVTGEKWLINNATRAHVICLLARTDPEGGARGFSLLLVDKTRLPGDAYRCLPAVRTDGIRGADISGIAFDGAFVPADAMIGAPGAGLEIVLKGLQLTRTLCAALSLGAADRVLRTALGFALRHRLYGRTVADLPHAARTLTEAYADLLALEATGLVTARGIHTLPGELSVASAVVKYAAPTMVDDLITRLGQVLGARAFLTGTDGCGVFQKVQRDHRIVGIFDGSTLVNLNSLINQFPALVRGHRRGLVDDAGLAGAVTLTGPLPPFDPAGLRLAARGGSSLVQSLPALTHTAEGVAPPSVVRRLKELQEIVTGLHDAMAGQRPSARDVPGEAFDLAHRYALCFVAAACAHLWLRNHEAMAGGETAGLWREALWLDACLARLLGRLRGGDAGEDEEVFEHLMPHLVEQYRGGRLFSPLSCRLAEEAR